MDIELTEKEELAIITLLACGLKYIWEARLEKKTVYLFKMRAEVEARVSVLRRTRHRDSGELIIGMLV